MSFFLSQHHLALLLLKISRFFLFLNHHHHHTLHNIYSFSLHIMDEYNQYLGLVNGVVSGDSPAHVRRDAELQLSNIHNNSDMWQHLLHFLSLAVSPDANNTDNVLFFIGIQRNCKWTFSSLNRSQLTCMLLLCLSSVWTHSQDKAYMHSCGDIGHLSSLLTNKPSSPHL